MSDDTGGFERISGQDTGGFERVSISPKTEAPHTTAGGLAASVSRGLAPIATGAAIGAAAGAPFGGVGAIPGAAAGAGAAALSELAVALYDPLAEKFGWPKVASPREMTDRVLDVAGVRRPSTGVERTTEAVAGGVGGALGPARAATELAASAASPIVRGVAGRIAEAPGRQAISGAVGALGGQAAAEAGAGPVGQYAASLAAGALPYGPRGAMSFAGSKASPESRKMIESGYVLPPTEIPPLGERQSRLSAALGAESGKIKLQQEASTRNQINTDRLAAEAIGLPPGVTLNEAAFEKARQPAIAVYNEVERAVPEVQLGRDAEYQRTVAHLGGKNSQVEKFFPEIAENPGILDLRRTMARNESVPMSVAMKAIADLRFQAGKNFRAIGDAQKHALALAQRGAADALEGAVERQVQNAPAYFAEKFGDALSARGAAEKAITHANTMLTDARSKLATRSNVYQWSSAKRAEEAALKELAQATAGRDAAIKQAENWRNRLMAAHEANEANQTLADRFRDARKLFAKIYTIEDATNRTTGNVSAAGIARAYNKGAPLTEQLETIADAYNTAPKSMQNPATFGRSEDWSALDFFGTAMSVAHGHPGVGLTILGRPTARRTLLSRPYQNAIIGGQSEGAPAPLVLNPGFSSTVYPDPATSAMGLQ